MRSGEPQRCPLFRQIQSLRDATSIPRLSLVCTKTQPEH